MEKDRKRAARAILFAGDVLSLALFILVGEFQHELLNVYDPIGRVITQTFSLSLAWFPLTFLLGVDSIENGIDKRGAATFLLRSILVWLYAAPLGLIFRAWIYGASTLLILFANAALVFGGLFVIAWRIVFIWGWLYFNGRRSAMQ